MDKTKTSDCTTDFELLTPDEFIHRLGICDSTLYNMRAKGWLIPGRHFIKIGSVVRYYWSEDRLREIHENSNREQALRSSKPIAPAKAPKELGERINWDY